MQPQLYVGQDEPTAERFRPVENTSMCLGAKPDGGFWTSTYNPETGSDWIRWCVNESFGVPRTGWKSWLLTPKADAQIVTIDCYMDLAGLLQQFGRNPFPFMDYGKYELPERLMPDFEKLASWGFSGVHLTERGQSRTRLSEPYNLYGWDCESTVWLDWAFEKVEYLGVCTWQERAAREIASLIAD